MTVEADINALNTTVTNLDTEITVDKAKLDSMEADAEALKTDASTYSTLASDYATEASTLKTAAQAYSTSIGSASPIVDLTALAESKADTALALFVYDTSKDSDGGAWRYKTQGTSWYNETLNTSTRGSRREFPAVALLVADSTKITIYDADDPSLPMWKVISEAAANGETTAIKMLNGLMVFGQYVPGQLAYASNRFETWDFIRDLVRSNGVNAAAYNGLNKDPIATARVAEPNGYLNGGYNVSCYGGVYDVDLTILPGTPIDSVTGMPRPTIVLGKYQGVSVVHYDDTVTNITSSIRYTSEQVAFGPDHTLYAIFSNASNGTYGGLVRIPELPTSNFQYGDVWGLVDSNIANYRATVDVTRALAPHEYTRSFVRNGQVSFVPTKDGLAVELSRDGFSRLNWGKSQSINDAMVVHINASYTTGWMVGDTKFAGLATTRPEAIIESNNLIVNGDFEDGFNNWTEMTSHPVVTSVTNGELTIEHGEAPGFGYPGVYQAIPTYVGQTYRGTVDQIATNTGFILFTKSDTTSWGGAGFQYISSGGGIGTHTGTFVATSALTYIQPVVNSYGTGNSITIDNVTVTIVEPDRTTNNNHLDVKGRITRTSVAEGAELMGYSGFSADNYLEMPYTADLDFGTGDFCIMGWFDLYNAYQDILTRAESTGLSAGAWRLYNHAAGVLRFYWHDGTSEVYGSQTSAPIYQQFSLLVIKRESGVLSIYQNNNLLVQFAHTDSLTCSGAVFSTKGADLRTQMALLRISATAPTADQIRKIYEDERVLFQPGAKCTLAGTSSPARALAYDSDTDELYIGTNETRNVFKGLRRVSYKETAVDGYVSAAKGMVIDE